MTAPPTQAGEHALAGLRAVVTGASSGIGRAIALAFSDAGADVLLTYRRSADAARAAIEQIAARGGAATALQADVATAAGCRALVAQARERHGRIDVWVNNAGADVLTGPAAAWPAERKLDALLAVDLRGTISCCAAVGPLMAAQPRGGAILNVGWDHASTGMAGENPELFAAVKAAVAGYSKSLARTLAPAVRVNVLCPGWIETSFGATAERDFHAAVAAATPLGRWGTPEDVAAAAVFLASPAAAFVTGQALNVNGGVVA